MTRQRRKITTPFNERKDKPQDDLLTTCKICRRGVFKGQERVWTKNGLIHKGCRVNEDIDVA